MADDIIKFQCGREAALCGQRRDGRMSKDWLAGFDMETAAPRATAASERAAVVAWLEKAMATRTRMAEQATNPDYRNINSDMASAYHTALRAIKRGDHTNTPTGDK